METQNVSDEHNLASFGKLVMYIFPRVVVMIVRLRASEKHLVKLSTERLREYIRNDGGTAK